jgi:hypothetical protein
MAYVNGSLHGGGRLRAALAILVTLAAPATTRADLTALLRPTPTPEVPVRFLAAPFTDRLEQTISRGTDFRATATTPGFTYRLNEELGVFEQSSTTLGPAFRPGAGTRTRTSSATGTRT